VIVDGGGFAGAPLHVRAFCALMRKPRFLRAIYPTFSRLYMRSRTDADRRAQRTGVATTRRDPGLRAVAELWRSFASPEHDLRERAAGISAPTLVIWGRRDPVLSVKLTSRILAAIPHAKLVVLNTGHVPHTSEPQRFADELLAFLGDALAEHTAEDRTRADGPAAIARSEPRH
jgi:pimeloyl-ACP methyl ester carboxylesterase